MMGVHSINWSGHLPVCNWNENHPVTGKTWEDMPGVTEDMKKMNFFFYRRGIDWDPHGMANQQWNNTTSKEVAV